MRLARIELGWSAWTIHGMEPSNNNQKIRNALFTHAA